MSARLAVAALLLAGAAGDAVGQSLLERSPNVQGTWTLPTGSPTFVFAHRFEFIDGANELLNIPTLTLAAGLPFGWTIGLDYSSNSEIIRDRTGTNETQYWLKRRIPVSPDLDVAPILAYNTAAHSLDGALNLRLDLGRVAAFGEVRGFTDFLGRGSAAAAATLGAALRLSPYLSLTGDVGAVISGDTVPRVWSGGVAMAIPGSPHTMSLQAGNGGVTTLQGASRSKTREFSSVRYGFAFTVPLGSAAQWSRLFRPSAAPLPPGAATDSITRVAIRLVAFTPAEIRIKAGGTVEWTNLDPVEHTVTADDESWGSELLTEGERYSRRFARPGRYTYTCTPHPMMKGVVIVEP